MNRLRCAIYTRKSSEEGLDQEYNSLDAQRDACAAYIVSQKGERWTASAARYDDGGWSGGSMERPGLKRRMADIEAGRVDVVVVYKVDRLTRSLSDSDRPRGTRPSAAQQALSWRDHTQGALPPRAARRDHRGGTVRGSAGKPLQPHRAA